MAVFPENMNKLDTNDVAGSLSKLENYIRYMTERVEFSTRNMTRNVNAAGTSTVETLMLLNDVASALSVVNSTVNGMIGDIVTTNNRVTELQNKHAALESKQANMESLQTEQGSKLVLLGTKQASLETKQSGLEAAQTAQGAKLSSLETKQTNLDTRQGVLETKQTQIDTMMTDLQRQITELVGRVAALEGGTEE